MDSPRFRMVETERGNGVTYDCGCPCQPTAYPGVDSAGFEHCCCGKVHFAGPKAGESLSAYLEDRAARRKREPVYQRGHTTVDSSGRATEVAWAFPVE